ncbi:hypothetical protein SAMN05216564_11345 [Halopenitus persicus]|uniref:Uncharacterized protein n=1 Tax=Halopenitus persicus TaxID=1048396 RepID=A0A1H3NKT5_9EURY|nr:hypothetical protein SAMN05216564_11345 [Halopenitus persicus]
MICPTDLMMYPMESVDMRWFVRGFASVLLGLSVGFSVAFIATPDPTGLLPIVVGLILTVALTAIFYAGIDRVTPSESE